VRGPLARVVQHSAGTHRLAHQHFIIRQPPRKRGQEPPLLPLR